MRTQFLSFRRSANRLTSSRVTCYFSPAPHGPRMSVIVPRNVSKLAITRNWLKRLTYDTLWPRIKDKGLDLVVVYKPIKLAKSTATKEQIISELSHLEFEKL